MFRSLYWIAPNECPHLIDSLRLRHILDFCLLNLKRKKTLYDSDIDRLLAISSCIEIYGSYEQENLEDVDDLRLMIEAIEKHGEIELFYEY